MKRSVTQNPMSVTQKSQSVTDTSVTPSRAHALPLEGMSRLSRVTQQQRDVTPSVTVTDTASRRVHHGLNHQEHHAVTSQNPTGLFCTNCGSTSHTRSHCPMPCSPTKPKPTDTGAKCASSCDGPSSTAGRGLLGGWREFVRFEALTQHAPFEMPQPSSGSAETVDSLATGADLGKRAMRPVCWWFGCDADYDAVHYNSLQDCWTEAPCKRCGAAWVSYSDEVGDTRHARARNWIAGLFRRQQPSDFNDSVPF